MSRFWANRYDLLHVDYVCIHYMVVKLFFKLILNLCCDFGIAYIDVILLLDSRLDSIYWVLISDYTVCIKMIAHDTSNLSISFWLRQAEYFFDFSSSICQFDEQSLSFLLIQKPGLKCRIASPCQSCLKTC